MPTVSGPDRRLAELAVTLPDPPPPLGAYVPVHIVGDMLYTSGVLPVLNGEVQHVGVVGEHLTLSDGCEAARLAALNLLALIRSSLGSLDAVRQVVQLNGFVRSAPGFGQQPKVLNCASDLLFAIFGERGRHTRIALGTADLPMGASVEVSAILRVFPDLVGRTVGAAAIAREPATSAAEARGPATTAGA